MVASKLEKMVSRSYLEAGFVSNTLNFFAVAKGDSDIRVVFDGTSFGSKRIPLGSKLLPPSARSAAMSLSFNTWMSDMDFGEMFHNFQMDPRLRPFSGVELGPMVPVIQGALPEEGRRKVKTGILRWTGYLSGMRPSPYNAVRHYYWGEEFARGNPLDMANPLGSRLYPDEFTRHD
jgi:hypothetical protein